MTEHLRKWWQLYLAVVVTFGIGLFLFFCRNCIPNEMIAPLLAAPLAIVALILAAQRTIEMNRTNKIAEERNATDIFSRAVDQLGHDNQAVRCGGIAALKQICESADKVDDDLRQTIIEVLNVFVRNKAAMPGAWKFDDWDDMSFYFSRERREEKNREEKLDVEDAVKALASITKTKKEREGLDLKDMDLRFLDLSKVNLSYFDFDKSDLADVNLESAKLIGVRLHVDINTTQLKEANVSLVHLSFSYEPDPPYPPPPEVDGAGLDEVRYYEGFEPILVQYEFPIEQGDRPPPPRRVEVPKEKKNLIRRGDKYKDYDEAEFKRLKEERDKEKQ